MRPAATYRGARRNEARNARKANKGKRVPMISFADILRINAMSQARAKMAKSNAAGG